MIERDPRRFPSFDQGTLVKIGAAVVVGLVFGVLVVAPPYLPVPANFQKLVWGIPIIFLLVVLFKNLERLILFAIAISVPLNLDFSVVISPFARNWENISRGYRTIIGLTELRISFVLIVVVIGYAIWLIRLAKNEVEPIRFFPATTIPAMGFILFSGLSVIEAQDRQLWLFRIAQLIEVFLIYFYLANHIRTSKDMQFLMVVSLGGLLAESVLMIVQWSTGLTFNVVGLEATMLGPGRIGGTLGHTGPTAGYLSSLSLIACALMWGFPNKARRFLAAASMGIGIVALISTGSRIGWIGFAITVLIFVLVGLQLGWVKGQTIAQLFLVVLVLGAVFSGTVYDRFTANDRGSAEARPMMWKLAWNVIRANPWLGVGAGNYALMTRDYYTIDIGNQYQVLDIQVHNVYLDIWAESGLFALLCFIGLLSTAIKKAWSGVNSRSLFVSSMGIGLGLAIISICIQMLTGTFHMRSITLFVWLLLAMATSLPKLSRSNGGLVEVA